MTSPKERRKARHRAEKTMDEAFEALLADRLSLAEKLARRAVAAGEVNPRLWLDLGRILQRCEQLEDAEEALRRAIALAPRYGEAFAELAAFQAAAGKWPQAERLQRRAVELGPGDALAAAKLATYAAMVSPAGEAAPADEPPPVTSERTDRFAWTPVATALRAHGAAVLERLASAEECVALRSLWDQPCFEYAASFDDDAAGRFECRWFAQPLPPLVQLLRDELYAHLAPIANGWQELLGRRTRFPRSLAAFLGRCIDAEQHRPTPCLLRLPIGGHRAPRRDTGQRVTFPFELALPLGPTDPGRASPVLRLLDVRGSRKHRQHAFSGAPGDGVLFSVAERLTEVAGVVGAQPVMHGTGEYAEEHFVLSVPFYDIG